MNGVTLDRVLRYLLAAAGLALVGWIVWYFNDLVVYLLAGLVLAYVLAPMVNWLQPIVGSRVLSIFATYVVVLGGVGFLIVLIVPFVGKQVTELGQMLSLAQVEEALQKVEETVRGYGVPLEAGALVERAQTLGATLFQPDEWVARVGNALTVFTDIFAAVVIVPFITFFFLKDGPMIRERILRLVPNRFFELTLSTIEKVEHNIGRYLRALLQQCLAVAAVATLVLWVIGLESALAVGIFTGLANTIPYFGPALGLVAGTVIGAVQTGDLSLFPGVAIAMLITQVADNVLFQPFLFSRASRTHPLVILCVVLIGAQLAGLPGMLLAIPVMTVLQALVQQVVWSLRNYRIFRVA